MSFSRRHLMVVLAAAIVVSVEATRLRALEPAGVFEVDDGVNTDNIDSTVNTDPAGSGNTGAASSATVVDTASASAPEVSDKPSDSVSVPTTSTTDDPKVTEAPEQQDQKGEEQPLKEFVLDGTTTDAGNQTIVNSTTLAADVPSVIPCIGCKMVNVSLGPFHCKNKCALRSQEAQKACDDASEDKPRHLIFHDCPNNCGGHGECKMYFFHSDTGGGWDLLPSNDEKSCDMKYKTQREYDRVYHYCECQLGSYGPDCSAQMPLKNRTHTPVKIEPYYLRRRAAQVKAKYGEAQESVPTCSSHGVWVPTKSGIGLGACVCNHGWDGPLCETRACPNNCHGNGVCIKGECICNKGFMGLDCSSGQCPDECSGHGQCFVGKCLCEKGFEPPNCRAPAEAAMDEIPHPSVADMMEKIDGYSSEPIDWEILNKTLTPGISPHEQVRTTQVKKDTSVDGNDYDELVKNVDVDNRPVVVKEDWAPFASTEGGKQSNSGCHTNYYKNLGPLGQIGHECSGHGTCVSKVNDGVGTPRQVYRHCQCFNGWEGDQCQTGSGPIVKEEDVEVPESSANATNVWGSHSAIPNLEMPLSNGTDCKDNCTSLGVCLAREVDGNRQSEGYCYCIPGYSGVACELECPGKCSGHGRCSYDPSVDRPLATCDCDIPFSGADCAIYGVNDTDVHISQVVESEADAASAVNDTRNNPDPTLGVVGVPEVVDLPSLPDHMKLEVKPSPLVGENRKEGDMEDDQDLAKLSGPDGIQQTTPEARRADPPPPESTKRHEGTPQAE